MRQNLRFALILLTCLALVAVVWLFLHGAAPTRQDDAALPIPDEEVEREVPPPAPSPRVSRTDRIDRSALGERVAVTGPSQGREDVYPGVILGRIRAYDGTPAANAAIAVIQTENQNPIIPPGNTVTRKTQTDSEGTFELTGLPMGTYSLWASTAGYAEIGQAHLTIERPVADFDMRLIPSGHLAGILHDTEGQPVANATLWAMQPTGAERFGAHRLVIQSVSLPTRLLLMPGPVTSDAEGKFRFEGLPQAPTYVLAVPKNAASAMAGPVRSPSDELAIEVTPGGAMSGRAVLAESDEPLAGIMVIAKGPTPREHFEAKTTDAGRFDFAALRPEIYEVAVDNDRYVLAQRRLPRVRIREGEIEDGIELRLVPAAGVSGRVYEKSSDKPLPGLYVAARAERGLVTSTVMTGPNGSYAITGMGPGDYQVFVISPRLRFTPAAQLANEMSITLESAQTIEGLDFGLSFGAVIQGYVLDEDGRPVSRADVTISTKQGARMRTEKTDEEGYFACAGFNPGDHLILMGRKLGLVSPEPVPVTIPSQGSPDDVTLILSPGARISGQVVRGSGVPVQDASVYLTSPPASFLRVNDVQSTGSEGTFAWDGLPAGDYTAGVIVQGSQEGTPPPTEEITVASGEQSPPVKLVWDGAGGEAVSLASGETGNRAIRGRVTDSEGNPISGVDINARAASGYSHMAQSLYDGTFEIAGIAPGTYSLRAFHQEYTPAEPQEVQAGEHNAVLVLQPPARASGQVIDAASGQPIQEFELAQVSTRYLERQSSLAALGWQRVFDPEGRFTVDVRLSRDPRVLVARARGYAPEHQPLGDVAAGQDITNMVFRLKAGAVVEGTVHTAAGQPVSGASIFQGRHEHRGAALARSDAQGAFRAEGLEAGTVEMTAYHPSYAPATVTVTTRLGAIATAEFVLTAGGTVEGFVTRGKQPVTSQMVSLILDDRHENSVTDANGHYVFQNLPAGVGTVAVSLRGQSGAGRQFLRAQRSVIVADNRVTRADFELSGDNAVVEGVVSIKGTPVSHAYVNLSLISAHGEQRTGTNVDANGYYRLENLSSGSAVLEVSLRSGRQRRDKTVTFDLQPGRRVRQDIDFGPVSAVTGTVRGVRDGEQAHVAVLPGEYDIKTPTIEDVQALAGMLSGYTQVSSDGTFVVENIEPGTYTVVGVAISGTPGTELEAFLNSRYVTETIEIEPGKPIEITLNL